MGTEIMTFRRAYVFLIIEAIWIFTAIMVFTLFTMLAGGLWVVLDMPFVFMMFYIYMQRTARIQRKLQRDW